MKRGFENMMVILIIVAVLAIVYLICCIFGNPKSEVEQNLEDQEQIAYLAAREARKKTERLGRSSRNKAQEHEDRK